MNREEAKYILSAYPVDGRMERDGQFDQALEVAARDPELKEWFAREQAIDAAIAGKLRTIAAPPELKSQLMAAQKMVQFPERRAKSWWWAAAAAALVLAASILWFQFSPRRGPAFEDFRTYVADAAARLDHLDVQTNNVAAARVWLAQHDAPADFVLPKNFAGRPSLGCRVFKWEEKRISLVCFEIENRRVAHVFVIDRAGINGAPPGSVAFQGARAGITTASWADAQRIYVVAIRDGITELEKALL